MGLVLMVGLFAGAVAGLALSVALVWVALVRVRRRAAGGAPIWRSFGVAAALLLVALVIAAQSLPSPQTRPGSDYDVLFRHLLSSGLAHGLSPGLAALLASLLPPRNPAPPT
jgi:hypothetical protein